MSCSRTLSQGVRHPKTWLKGNYFPERAIYCQLVLFLMLCFRYAVFIGLVIIVALCVASWFLAPKGQNQVLWRSSLILSIVSCYLMWAITFLAQLYPLIEPKRNDLREEFLGH
ncbi:H(+)-transporting V0 sector ATPase subunit e [Metarhizium acridum]|uniref:H(+)-transporting V0 sector ATPase subunit e n=1 Tax=Metarhizium acridum TaxID=92637 RepID=UPI001C6AEACB|nr:H(+)-transporting V0 sector ATPase subunit e [Metarhizium acridum]